MVGTGHLLCFWNIACVATKEEAHPAGVEPSQLVLHLPQALETLWAGRSTLSPADLWAKVRPL